MALFKLRLRRQPPADSDQRPDELAPPPPSGPAESIDSLRRRARQRLLGAAVLVLVAVIGFPLLFDTPPRPMPVDAPIIIPDKNATPPLRLPAQPASAAARASAPASVDSSRGPAAAPQPPASRASAPALAASQARQPAAAPPRPAASAPKPATPAADAHAKQEEQARAKREQEARAKREADARAARARALLEGRATPASAPASRFVVQVGAFATADKARQARQQAERAGVKTYVQVVNTTDGQRTRVRAGPYTSQAEANKALAALKKAGLSGSVLAL